MTDDTIREGAIRDWAFGEGAIREIEQFLYREARLLDERRFRRMARSVYRGCALFDVDARQLLPEIEQGRRHPRSLAPAQ